MAIIYSNLWKVLLDNGMNKTALRKKTGISTATLARLSANEKVSIGVIEKICATLNVQPGDIMEYVSPKAAGGKVQLSPHAKTLSLHKWRIKK